VGNCLAAEWPPNAELLAPPEYGADALLLLTVQRLGRPAPEKLPAGDGPHTFAAFRDGEQAGAEE
jgi:hypothetical protein